MSMFKALVTIAACVALVNAQTTKEETTKTETTKPETTKETTSTTTTTTVPETTKETTKEETTTKAGDKAATKPGTLSEADQKLASKWQLLWGSGLKPALPATCGTEWMSVMKALDGTKTTGACKGKAGYAKMVDKVQTVNIPKASESSTWVTAADLKCLLPVCPSVKTYLTKCKEHCGVSVAVGGPLTIAVKQLCGVCGVPKMTPEKVGESMKIGQVSGTDATTVSVAMAAAVAAAAATVAV